jgi:hypothetical protein
MYGWLVFGNIIEGPYIAPRSSFDKLVTSGALQL